MEILGVLWDEVIMRPMINSIALLYTVLFSNFGLSIIVFTGIIRVALIPLTIRQTRQMKKMSEMQPKIKALQEKYKNKTGREERSEMSRETMRLYREAGVNPVGCLGPVFIQIPIWIGLYRAILRAVPPTPEGLANLNDTLYSWNPAAGRVPLDAMFVGIDLVDFVQAAPMYFAVAMPILVGVSMFIQQKMSTPPSTDPRQAQTNQIMLWTMPVMFGFFTLQFPSGLGLYILFSNVLGIAIQYFVSPKQSREALVSLTSSITRLVGRSKPAAQQAEASVTAAAIAPPGEKQPNGEPDVHREDGRRSNRDRSQVSRRKARGRRHKGR
jgi:YidC/Oxa1 family membrane protein insertase